MAAYNASKFGLNGFSEALMQEVRHDGIKVSYIMPGSVNTEFGGDEPSEEKSWQLQPEDIARVVSIYFITTNAAFPAAWRSGRANRQRNRCERRSARHSCQRHGREPKLLARSERSGCIVRCRA